MTDTITPGSLTARVLGHMIQAGGEYTAAELAEALGADATEVRQALGTLRKGAKVLQRNEDGKPVYRLPEAANMRIPGSSRQPIPSPLELRTGSTEPEENPIAPTRSRKAKPAVEKALAPIRPGTERARIFDYITAQPGSTTAEVAAALKLDEGSPYFWTPKGVPLPPVQTSATPAKAERKPRKAAAKAPRKAAKNLAALGKPTPAKAARGAPGAVDAPQLAIDANGTVAIESLKLSPVGIEELVAFLEKTQSVWRGAVA